MPYSHLNDFPADVRERAAKIRLAAFDVDGTLTDGKLTLGAGGRETKSFHVADGLGLRLLEQYGIAVAFITARPGTVVVARARELGLQHVFVNVKDKLKCLDALSAKLGVSREEIAFMGDDLPDLRALAAAGLAVAPANAHPWVRERVHWRTQHAGGAGAARELCDLILAARGHADAIIEQYTGA
ncbi:MAG TPA: HAD hydrolase family protein [Xanthomonadaceae bacterium]|jgi:3-deoxy-D-manno-octulosonate 8-phosphate phosphatase (KDO 8-P phosphatase)